MKRIIIAALLFILAVSAYLLFSGAKNFQLSSVFQPEAASVNATEAKFNATRAKSNTITKTKSEPTTSAALKPTPAYSTPLHQRFLAANDYHQLYQSLLGASDAESLFYRAFLLDSCANFGSGSQQPSPESQLKEFETTATPNYKSIRVSLMKEHLKHSRVTKCAAFPPTTKAAISTAYAEAAAAGSAHAKVVQLHNLLSGNTVISDKVEQDGFSFPIRTPTKLSAEAVETLKQALSTKDPALIRTAGRILDAKHADYELRYEVGITPDTYVVKPDLWDSVACHFAGGCGVDSFEYQNHCIHLARCDVSSFDEILQKYMMSEGSYAAFLANRQILIDAIEKQNWGLLKESRGKPTNIRTTQLTKPRNPPYNFRP